MKKIFCVIIAVTMIIGLCACYDNKKPAESTTESPTEATVQSSAVEYSESEEPSEEAVSEDKAGAMTPGIATESATNSAMYSKDSVAMGGYDGYEETSDDSWRYQEIDPEEEYDDSEESPFKDVKTSPLSTFSSDVDTASYSNMRRMINNGQKPEGIRIEELVNYFDYDYPAPKENSDTPFTISTEISECPWNDENLLAMVGVQGAEKTGETKSNVVFLLDVSGSMDESNKLPLLKDSFKLLIDKLDKNDRVSIVTYAGSDQIIADSVSGDNKKQLKNAIDDLYAGGSTAGAAGIKTAYELAEKNFIKDGNNRIILATDGDFNVGESSVEALTKLIEKEREKGINISVLGFGMWNLKDNMMETIADHGNGNYAYIDTYEEAKKVLVDELDSTMFVIAKDLKFQLEFNPNMVAEYRLIGYDNRRLENEDFNDDKKDAGDIGAGHSVTAFYEIVPVKNEKGSKAVDDLKYQTSQVGESKDFFTVKVRYKAPDGDVSKLVEREVKIKDYTKKPSKNFTFASAVVEFGLILKDSDYKGDSSLSNVVSRAKDGRGDDEYNLRKEFVELAEKYKGQQ